MKFWFLCAGLRRSIPSFFSPRDWYRRCSWCHRWKSSKMKKWQKIPMIKFSLIGRPNVGKSQLDQRDFGRRSRIASPSWNHSWCYWYGLYGQWRSEFTTWSTRLVWQVRQGPWKYGEIPVMRARRAIDRSDVVLMVLNAEEGIREYDKRIAGFAHEAGKGIIIVVKSSGIRWKKITRPCKFEAIFATNFPVSSYAPIVFCISSYQATFA